IKVTDKDGAIMARKLSRDEGLFVGWSSGSAVHGALEYAREHMKENDVMVILLPDHGTRYLAKVYNDQWMQDHGFLETRTFSSARDILRQRVSKEKLITVNKSAKVSEAILVFNREGIDQVPVIDDGQFVGSINASSLLAKIIQDPQLQ